MALVGLDNPVTRGAVGKVWLHLLENGGRWSTLSVNAVKSFAALPPTARMSIKLPEPGVLRLLPLS